MRYDMWYSYGPVKFMRSLSRNKDDDSAEDDPLLLFAVFRKRYKFCCRLKFSGVHAFKNSVAHHCFASVRYNNILSKNVPRFYEKKKNNKVRFFILVDGLPLWLKVHCLRRAVRYRRPFNLFNYATMKNDWRRKTIQRLTCCFEKFRFQIILWCPEFTKTKNCPRFFVSDFLSFRRSQLGMS